MAREGKAIPAETAPAATAADDAALMAALAAKDEKALATLYDKYSKLVFGVCLRALPPAGAEEVVLDVFWELWDRADRYDASRGAPLVYLLGVTRSRMLDKLRASKARKRQVEQQSSGSAAEASTPGPLGNALLAEQRARVAAALSQLSGPQRAAVEMAFYEALSHSEIAERIGEPLGTVKSRIRQALIRLRDLLLEQGD